jgi:DNA processing protein
VVKLLENILIKLWFFELKLKNDEKLCVINSNISIEEFYNMSFKDYVNSGFDYIKADNIQRNKSLDQYTYTARYLEQENTKLILYNECEYPEILKSIYNPPLGFFIKGKLPEIDYSIAIVGARKASEYGKTAAYKLARELTSRGFTIVSGLAKGIDTSAHLGALDGGGPTIAVIGSGFKKLYPPCNKKLAEDISNNGCIVTEYLPDIDPFPRNFPERNRIISGLSKSVLVVEAGERSGSLITAGLALEQGKDVYAIPGNIFSPNSIGTNKLIKDGAKPVTDINDILDDYNICYDKKISPQLEKEEMDIYNIIKTGGVNVDDIINNSEISAETVLSALCKLECKGFIKKGYGNYYITC